MSNVTILDMDAFKDVNVEIKIDGESYKFTTPKFQHVMVIQELSTKMSKAQSKLTKEDNDENNLELDNACYELIVQALSYDNETVPSEYIKSMSSLKKVRLATSLAIYNSEAFTGGTGSGI